MLSFPGESQKDKRGKEEKRKTEREAFEDKGSLQDFVVNLENNLVQDEDIFRCGMKF